MSKLNKAIAFDCENIQQGGNESAAIVIAFDDYAQAKKDAGVTIGVTGEIDSIVLPTGQQGYEFQAPKDANILGSETGRQVEGIDGYDHSVKMVLGTIEAVDVAQISCNRFQKWVIIVKLTEGRSRLYGGGVGLRMGPDFNISDGDAALGGTISFTSTTDSRGPAEVNTTDLIASSFDLATLLVPAI